MLRYCLIFFAFLVILSCQKDDLAYSHDNLLREILELKSPTGSTDFYKLPKSNDFSSIPQDPMNPISTEKVVLGKLLFHETGFGRHAKLPEGRKTYSCASCHNITSGFMPNLPQGIADGGLGIGLSGEGRFPNPNYLRDSIDVQPIRPPSNLNTCYQEALLWNGSLGSTGVNGRTSSKWESKMKANGNSYHQHTFRNNLGFHGLETQAIVGQDVHRLQIDENTITELGYKPYFDAAYFSLPVDERYTSQNAAFAIAAYERTLLTNQAPWQKWLNGELNTMTEREKYGAILFFSKAKCNTCHSGPALNSMEFHALGFNDLTNGIIQADDEPALTNLGRGGFTENEEEYYKFKVPQLYNLKNQSFYGHGGSFTTLEKVVLYFNQGRQQNSNVPEEKLSEHFKPLNLTAFEIEAITDFLENSLYDSELNRYFPDELPSGNCFPNADVVSKVDLGCQ